MKSTKREPAIPGWVCPKCLTTNPILKSKCKCKIEIDSDDLRFYGINVSSKDLWSAIDRSLFIGADDRAFILRVYLVKRFPDSPEAMKVRDTNDVVSKDSITKYNELLVKPESSVDVICGKCGTKNIYNEQHRKCRTCGDWLHQYMVRERTAGHSMETNGTSTSTDGMVRCPKCRSTQLSAQKKGYGWGKGVIGAVLTGGVGLLAGSIGSRKIYITCLSCGHQFRP